MRTYALLILAFMGGILRAQAQTTYQEGYFIRNNTEKVVCLIKNMDWANNPTTFQYKLSKDAKVENATIREVQEFEITNAAKYKRFTVKIDTSGTNYNNLSNNLSPEFAEKTLFLKLLVDGKAKLYQYQNSRIKRFFYQREETLAEQLVYKKYLDKKDIIKQNDLYKSQLMNSLKCEQLTSQDFIKLEYSSKALTNLFIKYNVCAGVDAENYKSKSKKDIFNLSIRTGLNATFLTIKGGTSGALDAKFNTFIYPRIGLEAEFMLPFNNNTWSIILEPNYIYHKSSQGFGNQETVQSNYKAIEMPLGLRYHIFANPNAQITMNIGYAILIPFSNSKLDYEANRTDIEIGFNGNLVTGLGFNYLNRFNAELRYGFKKDLASKYPAINANHSSISLIVGYNLTKSTSKNKTTK